MKIEFTVLGEPQGKGRPRFANIKGRTITRTPDKTVLYENWVKVCYAKKHGETQRMLVGAIEATITAYFSVPKSASKAARAKMLSGETHHIKKIDSDNLAKVILDSLNGIVYHDDAQVSKLTVEKLYGQEPRVEVVLAELED